MAGPVAGFTYQDDTLGAVPSHQVSLQAGYQGLGSQGGGKRGYWNQMPEKERNQVVELALQRPELSCRELAWHMVDQEGRFTPRRA